MGKNVQQWSLPRYSLSDEGEFGLFPAIDMARKDGTGDFHVHVHEDGTGGLVVNIYGSSPFKVDVNVDDTNRANVALG